MRDAVMQRISECDAIFLELSKTRQKYASWCSRFVEEYIVKGLGTRAFDSRDTGGPERRASLPLQAARRGCKGGASRRFGQRECRKETTLIAAQHRTGGGSARTVISVPGAALHHG